MNVKVVVRESFRSIFLDYSFTVLVVFLLILNEVIMLNFGFFEDGIYLHPIWLIYFFNSLILMAYGGYIGSKFFAREFENNTIVSLIVTPLKRTGVFFSKSIASVLIGLLIVLVVFLQIIFSILYYGTVAYLLIYWNIIYAYLAFLSYLFSFFLAISVGTLIRRSGLTLLVSSIYVILSFFMLVFMPMEYVINGRFYYSLFFPFLGTWYVHLSIEFYAIVYGDIYLIPLGGVLWIFAISYLLFKGVKI